MRVGLFGFGRTGKAVATILLQSKESHLCWVIRKSKVLQHRSVPEFLGIQSDEPGLIFPKDEWTPQQLFKEHPVDVLIDFSSAEAILSYGEEAARREIAIVSAISEYPSETIDFLGKLSQQTRVLWSPNITIGINFMMLAAKVLTSIAPYTDIEIIEEHFKAKKEVSGTARRLAKALSLPEESIKTIRAGGIVGRHEILIGFPYQTIRLIHESISREAFGNGVLFAAQNLVDRATGFYTMEDLLIPYFNLK
ncbi:MAG: dihydrodipicolinate reductase C-terminal domain-containing protein [Dehalococcoidia bacterium]|nr:dihydrodipicolinate reductase C-terminal domain-containing protein [Dehalococcoidia bacterium]MDD5494943.1 dihydrodipicolinate reductase C-terminal domain-containing protein [Dehalococcoidia bacterium]